MEPDVPLTPYLVAASHDLPQYRTADGDRFQPDHQGLGSFAVVYADHAEEAADTYRSDFEVKSGVSVYVVPAAEFVVRGSVEKV